MEGGEGLGGGGRVSLVSQQGKVQLLVVVQLLRVVPPTLLIANPVSPVRPA